MATILNEHFTATGDSTGDSPAYSSWATVGSATTVNVGVTVSNDYAADIVVQWTDDPDGPPPDDADVLMPGMDPESGGQHYYVHADGLTPEGTHVRIKTVAWDMDAPCHAVITTA